MTYHPISHWIKPEDIHRASLTAGVVVILLLIAIYFYLFRKRMRFRLRKNLTEELQDYLTNVILADESIVHELSPGFRAALQKKAIRQFVINELIQSRKNISGLTATHILELYIQLGLRKDSIRKFKSLKWYRKASGIHELYMMEQVDMLPPIAECTNSRYRLVRTEAQIALLYFQGFEGLHFLDHLAWPVTEWQQIKLLTQLRSLQYSHVPGLGRWLQSDNESVVQFALKLAEIYQQFQVYDLAAACLQHTSAIVRRQAVSTIVCLPQEDTAGRLIRCYYNESRLAKLHILKYLAEVATDEEQDFLLLQLQEPDDDIRLAAARILVKCCSRGQQLLQQMAASMPGPYVQIAMHIQKEMAL